MRAGAVRAQSALAHRGPDDEGVWQSACGQAVLAHRRLSIIDLSSGGHQPMTTADGRYTIAFNGEIYNFRELREALERTGVKFHTTSDTEVILRMYEAEGSACVKRLRGMFAFALWDDHTRTALLARDPLGIKPLYVHRTGGTLAFASELRALVQGRWFEPSLDAEGVRGYLETGSVPEPLTLVREVQCLEAGTTLEWHEGRAAAHRYWHVEFDRVEPVRGDVVVHTRAALLDSVQHHFVSDVPVGVFLSGGIDSTVVLALAGACGHHDIRSFCISVDDPSADEGDLARRTAAHFGTQHEEARLDAVTAQGLFDQFLKHVDQPSIDGLNTFTVSSLARKAGMKVVLSGLGGDEMFGGYSSFRMVPAMRRWHRLARIVPGARMAAGLLLSGSSKRRRMGEFMQSPGGVMDAWMSLRSVFAKADAQRLASWLTGERTGEHSMVLPHASQPMDQLSVLELTRYMRNQLLRDSDVMSMAHGLELRVPFVDRVLLEAVARVPAPVRLKRGKRLLTDAVPEVPEWIVKQKKRGFLFPFAKWLGAGWGDSLDNAARGSPVKMESWYQRWSLFMLRHSAQELGLELNH